MDKTIDLSKYIRSLRNVRYGEKGSCGVCEGNCEGFMVTNDLWKIIHDFHKKNTREIICLNCSHKAIKRNFIFEDFTDAPINQGIFVFDASLFVLIQEYYYER